MDDNKIHHHRVPSGYEKIRTVGKGAFGTAYLYRRMSDDQLVVIKEVLIEQMTRKERLLALNEIRVLSSIHHPNIVSYYDSFELEGALMIEMEYADGGALDQYLSRLSSPMSEYSILPVLEQMASALDYIHHRDKPILHRDLKPANIFLMATGLRIKIGDFGISKILTTQRGDFDGLSNNGSTFVGTPFYTSPEIYERKSSDAKSDIWSVGCILYEMASLRKPFEADNLMALYKAVVQGRYPPLRGQYSALFKLLIRDTLQHEPEFRPSARQILEKRLPDLMSPFYPSSTPSHSNNFDNVRPQDTTIEVQQELLANELASATPNEDQGNRSVLYRVNWNREGRMELEPFQALASPSSYQQVTVSRTHLLTLSTERQVTMHLMPEGLAIDLPDLMTTSSEHDQLQGKDIIDVVAGDGFSIFVTSSGIVMTCGIGKNGCLGHGDLSNVSSPKVIEKLLALDIKSVVCGPTHVVAVPSHGGTVFSWGSGTALGLSSSTLTQPTPTEMKRIPAGCIVTGARCGPDATILLTDGPLLLACGDNRSNRLGLNPSSIFFRTKVKSSIVDVITPVKIPSASQHQHVGRRVMDASIGFNRSVLLSESGHFIILGGEVGSLGPASYTWMDINGVPVVTVSCAGDFTTVLTSDCLYHCWGSIDLISEEGTTTLEWPNPSPFLALYASEDQVKKGRIIRPGKLRSAFPSGATWLTIDSSASSSASAGPPVGQHLEMSWFKNCAPSEPV